MKNTPNFAKASLDKQKGFSTLLGLLLFIVLAVGGLYLYTEKVFKEMPDINFDFILKQNPKKEIINNDVSKALEIMYLSSNELISENGNGHLMIAGKEVNVVGKNLGGCRSVNNCELVVHLGDKTVSVIPSNNSNQSSVTFIVPVIEKGYYDLYIENLATGQRSNIVKVTTD